MRPRQHRGGQRDRVCGQSHATLVPPPPLDITRQLSDSGKALLRELDAGAVHEAIVGKALPVTGLPESSAAFSVAGSVVVHGGLRTRVRLSVFNPATGTVKALPADGWPSMFDHFAVKVHGHRVLLLGGCCRHSYIPAFRRVHVVTTRSLATMACTLTRASAPPSVDHARMKAVAVLPSGRAVLAVTTTGRLCRLDVSSMAWTVVCEATPAMPHRGQPSLVVLHGRFAVLHGGMRPPPLAAPMLSTFAVDLDSPSPTWQLVRTASGRTGPARSGHVAATVADSMWVWGGQATRAPVDNEVWMLRMAAGDKCVGTWSRAQIRSKLPPYRAQNAAAVMLGPSLVILSGTQVLALEVISQDSIPVPPSTFAADLGVLLESGVEADVVVEASVDGYTRSAHAVVLHARWPWARPFLDAGCEVLSVPTATESTLPLLLTFLYTNRVTVPAAEVPAMAALVSSVGVCGPLRAAVEDPEPGADAVVHQQPASHLPAAFKPYATHPALSDVAVSAGGCDTLPAHRCLLVARSAYLAAGLRSGLLSGDALPLTAGVEGVHPAVLPAVLKFVYTDTLSAATDPEALPDVLRVAVAQAEERLAAKAARLLLRAYDLTDPESVLFLLGFAQSLGDGGTARRLQGLFEAQLRSTPGAVRRALAEPEAAAVLDPGGGIAARLGRK